MMASRAIAIRPLSPAVRLVVAAVAGLLACGPTHHDAIPPADDPLAAHAPDRPADRAGPSGSPSAALPTPREVIPARVVHVIDGDTLDVAFEVSGHSVSESSADRRGARGPRQGRNTRSVRVRLLGVDAPEAHPGPKLDRDARRRHRDQETILALGRRATSYTLERLDGQSVRLELDVRERDKYGRLLAWVWLDDGSLFNANLVRDGYARTMTIPPNVKYSDRLRGLEREARRQDRGLWRDGM